MIIHLHDRHIDNGWYKVSTKEARMLCLADHIMSGGMFTTAALPKPGRERRVKVNGEEAWLARTQVNGKVVWAIHGMRPNIASYRKGSL